MTVVSEGFLGLRPRGQSALDVTEARVLRELDELVNLCGESALPADVGYENLVAVLNDCAVGRGNCKLQLFDGGEDVFFFGCIICRGIFVLHDINVYICMQRN